MLVVAALGGNALLPRGEPSDPDRQRQNAGRAARALAPILRDHSVVVTHGNGPQVGELAARAVAAGEPIDPIDVLDAQTEGTLGYLLAQELHNAARGRSIAALLTQVVVDPADPAFGHPDKPIGTWYAGADAAQAAARAHGWTMAHLEHGWRRVVASPRPRRIVELAAVRALLEGGIVPIAVGGGGIPVVEEPDGARRGVEAVVDKDRSAALLASELGADVLLLLTDVDGAYTHWGRPEARRIARSDPQAIRSLPFAPGSMAPKVEAAAAFAEAGGVAVIGALDDAAALLAGAGGTRVDPDAGGLTLAG